MSGPPIPGCRALITGGAGFVGSHTADQLLAAGAGKVIALDNLVRGSLANVAHLQGDPRFELVRGDVRDRALLDRLTAGCDYVVHLAALRITACAADPREAHQVMADGSFNVLESAARHKVGKIVAASSASVYGEPDQLPISEDAPFNNRTLYGAYKVALEQMLRSFEEMYGIPYVAFRYFNLYGPRMDMTGVYTEVMVRWMDRIDAGEAPLIFGRGDQSMDFVYVEDAARANLMALGSPAPSDVYNVATGQETSLLQLCQLMLRLMGRPDLQPEFRPERTVNPVRRRRGATEKAARGLSFQTRVDLESGLSRLVRWRRETDVASDAPRKD